MKYIFSIVIVSLFFGIGFSANSSGCEERTFVVTAYYSPVANQAFYYKPTFEAEKILNGEGYFGASGKKVFNGMLAGPSTYKFGTMIYFPGFGLGEIADRGGAIVPAGERGRNYDRIDIWMGHGEEGLVRALTFGKKTLTGYFCDSSLNSKKIKFGFDFKTIPVLKNFFDMAIWLQKLDLGRQDIRVWTLQKYLINLGFLDKGGHSGKYDLLTKKAVCNYQVKRGIVSRYSNDCGKYGSQTRYAMKLEVEKKGLLPSNLRENSSIEDIISQARLVRNENVFIENKNVVVENNSSSVLQVKKNVFQFYRPYTINQISSEIKILQTFLADKKLYAGNVDGIYSKKVIDSVYEFQKKYGLLNEKSNINLRGYFGPGTRKKVNELRN